MKQPTTIGKSYGQLKQVGTVKQTKSVGRQDFIDPDTVLDESRPTMTAPLGQLQGAVASAVRIAEDELRKADEDFFTKRQAAKEHKEAMVAKDDKEAEERGLRESLTSQKSRMKAEMQWDFFCCVIFQSEEQRRAFLEAIRWNWKERGGIYIDGQELAKAIGVALPPGPTWKNGEPKDIWEQFSFDESFFDD
jgi:hypothetical protein